MSKEYVWKLPVEDTEKEISCEVDGNKYFIYIGDAFVTTFYKTSSGELDEEIDLCGVPCRFVAFNEKPDLLIEGSDILLGSGKSYAEQKKASHRSNTAFALMEIFIGLFALVAFTIWTIVKNNFVSYLPVFVFPLAFIVFGVWELYNLNKKNKKREKKEKTEE